MDGKIINNGITLHKYIMCRHFYNIFSFKYYRIYIVAEILILNVD